MHLQLHLTDDTQLRAHGYIAVSDLLAEVCWRRPIPDSRLDEGTAIQAEEEACWQAHQATTAARAEGRVA